MHMLGLSRRGGITMRPGVTSDTERPTLSSRAVASGKTVLLGRTFDDAYFGAFVMVLLACWSPLKWLPYVAPLAAIIWMGAAAGGRIIWLRLLQWTLGWVVWILAFGTFKADFTWHSAFIALVTYSTFAFVWIVPASMLGGRALVGRLARLTCGVVLFEALFGIVQVLAGYRANGTFDLDTGDWVQGTIYPHLDSSHAFANPMFAANMAFMLLAVAPMVMREKRWRLTFAVGAVSLVLASVMHVLFLLAASLLFAAAFYRPKLERRTSRAVMLGLCVSLPVLAGVLLRTNIWTLSVITEETVSVQTPRSKITMEAFADLPAEYPAMPLIGLGPGQFSSRAALIGTGLYFGGLNPKEIPLMPQGSSRAFQDYLERLWLDAIANPFYGSTQQPVYSWLSVYTEFGGIVFILLAIGIAAVLLKLKRAARTASARMIAASTGSGIVLLALLGVQENYWETPQAILIGAMLLKATYAQLVYGVERQDSEDSSIRRRPLLSDVPSAVRPDVSTNRWAERVA
jgi:hypothetical protein